MPTLLFDHTSMMTVCALSQICMQEAVPTEQTVCIIRMWGAPEKEVAISLLSLN